MSFHRNKKNHEYMHISARISYNIGKPFEWPSRMTLLEHKNDLEFADKIRVQNYQAMQMHFDSGPSQYLGGFEAAISNIAAYFGAPV